MSRMTAEDPEGTLDSGRQTLIGPATPRSPRRRVSSSAGQDAAPSASSTASHQTVAPRRKKAVPATAVLPAVSETSPRAPRPGASGNTYTTAKLPTLTAAQPRVSAPPGDSTGTPATSGTRKRETGAWRTLADSQPRLPRVSAEQGSPRATAVLPAVGDELPAPTAETRRITTARPVSSKDTALVARATVALQAIEVAGADRSPALVSEATDDSRSVTLITGSLRPDPWAMPRPKAHPLRVLTRGMTVHILGAVVILAVLMTATPLLAAHVFQTSPTQLAATTASLQHADHGASAIPSGPWDTSAGAVNTLGLGGGAAPGVKAPGSAGLPVKTPPPKPASQPQPQPQPQPVSGISPAPFYPWPPSDPYMSVSGHPSFAMNDPGGYYSWAFGQCTWWAQYKRQDENLAHMGNAEYWASSAAARGYRVGSWPAVGATVVFQPGVQGAGGAGHVAHVEAVYPDGWFLISEMNFYVNGGGWGRVDYRYAHTGWGVQFIY